MFFFRITLVKLSHFNLRRVILKGDGFHHKHFHLKWNWGGAALTQEAFGAFQLADEENRNIISNLHFFFWYNSMNF